MEIFKFGGASLQNALAIREFTKIVNEYKDKPLIVVVSAMGKITQALEEIFEKNLTNQPYEAAIEEVYLFHLEIVETLLGNSCTSLQHELDKWKKGLIQDLQFTYSSEEIEKVYSKVIAWGEILSSRLIYYYLIHIGIPFTWVDARKYIKTKSGFMNASLDEHFTRKLIQSELEPLLTHHKLLLTQGFIASDHTGSTTTLGKEGSDFTGAILAAGLKATSLTIWKDVPGIMNADPKIFQNTVKFDELDYETMANMSFYGAQVVHPKTIHPLAAHDIPLHIRPFKDKHEKGTLVNNKLNKKIDTPIYILKKDQIFIKLSLGKLIFFEENHLNFFFQELNRFGLRINFLERTPYSISTCLTNDYINVDTFLDILKPIFKTTCYASTQLLTIIGQIDEANLEFFQGKTILAKQYNTHVYQIVFLN